MNSWQNIFVEKLKKKHITEPWKLLEDNTIQANVLKPRWTEHVQRSASGRFRCSRCCHTWSSAKVHILFHMHRSRSSGEVRMRVFRQACRQCSDGPLEEPTFSPENLAKILDNLVLVILQECYHVPVQASDFTEVVVEVPVTGPHDSTRCEGCRLGVCRKPRPAPAAPTRVNKTSSSHTRRDQGLSQQVTPVHHVPSFSNSSRTLIDQGLSQQVTPVHHVPSFSNTSRTRIDQGLSQQVIPIHHVSSFSNTSHWKRYCCLGVCLLCVLAVLLFLIVYFIIS